MLAGGRIHVPRSIAVIGNYLPRQCGIATFTTDLCEALAHEVDSRGGVEAVVMDDVPEGYPYPERVKFQLRANTRSDYLRAAEFINVKQFDVVCLQHEYGIFGGPDGADILWLVKSLRMPVITTLHSVLRQPQEGQKAIIQELADCSAFLVVLSEKAAELLGEVYDVPKPKIAFIPHGIPDIPFREPDTMKGRFGVEGREVILTFGLLGPGKGVEVMLDAMPAIIARRPNAVYLVLGATHPNILRVDGDKYLHSLQMKATRLGIRSNVLFHNRFVNLETLCRYLSAADVYVTPYPSKEQIVSGTLAYAMGAGAAVVSTPYWYAQEMLADGRGRIVPFGDSAGFAREIVSLLESDESRAETRRLAYRHCRPMVWKEVARSYVELFGRAIENRAVSPHPHLEDTAVPQYVEALPEPDLRHLRTLTDDTGIFQHADHATPNRSHGYCVDDNARALVAACMYHHMSKDESVVPLIQIYLSFIHDAFNRDRGRFRNFMSYDRRWLDDVGSEDAHGRALWGLGEAVRHAPSRAICDLATSLFNDALEVVLSFEHPRPMAFTLLGIHAYLEQYGGDSAARRVRGELAGILHERFQKNAVDGWPWCDGVLTHANGVLPHALLLSGQWIPDGPMCETAVRTLEWLIEQQTAPEGHLSIIGCEQWYTRGGVRSKFDQQPIELMGLMGACAQAYRATGEKRWLNQAQRCLRWFMGENDLSTPLYDYQTGGCHDALHPDRANANQGAESLLAWLICLLTMYSITGEELLTPTR